MTSKRRAIYTITPPCPQASDAPPRVSESPSLYYYPLPQQRPAADPPPRKTSRSGTRVQLALPFEEDQASDAPSIPRYTITTGWIDATKRIRTWKLLDPDGNKMAEICTKRDTRRIADLLNELLPFLLPLPPDPQGGPLDPAP